MNLPVRLALSRITKPIVEMKLRTYLLKLALSRMNNHKAELDAGTYLVGLTLSKVRMDANG